MTDERQHAKLISSRFHAREASAEIRVIRTTERQTCNEFGCRLSLFTIRACSILEAKAAVAARVRLCQILILHVDDYQRTTHHSLLTFRGSTT